MKVILYMAITANGMIARKNLETPWSDEEFSCYFNKVKEVGNVIVGNTTYPQFRESDFADMGNPLMVVLTRNSSLQDKSKIKFANSVSKALEIIKQAGFDTALVTGGGKTNAAFLQDELIDEIYLDIEPLIFGQGMPLFDPIDYECKLELLEVNKLSNQLVQLHYKVIK